jgi:DNA-binding NarL/FixJ family response regulator
VSAGGRYGAAALVLVVDDDAGFREFVCTSLTNGGFDARPAVDGTDALRLIGETRPAAIVLDVNMPGLSGYEICRLVKTDLESYVAVIFVSGDRTESFDRVAGLMIGADDYLTKPVAPDELLARLRVLLRRSGSTGRTAAGLSRREFEVLVLLAEGLAQAQIAERLVISTKTVGTHIERILSKLGAHSRAEAVSLAYRLQLVGLPV